jgi:hypothetical protein
MDRLDHQLIRVALGVGGGVWFVIIGVYAASLATQRPGNMALPLLYNAPIGFIFLVLLAHMTLKLLQLGPLQFLRANVVLVALWVVGAALLYLRLISKSVEVSGHLAWLPLLTVQLWVSAFPRWMITIGIISTLSVIYLKFAIFRGPSGLPGLIAGVILAAALVLLRSKTPVNVTTP